ncbi:inositol monophosphatase family protein [Actinospongicola halichondriae]|uniref:inositol monophosphatase family protein n=1 Tax=Actinospongicola halichondriae TaxID=3236844 RepID=UPI003D481D4C
MTCDATLDRDPAVLRDLAVDIADAAADLLADRLDDERSDVSTKSTGTDMVTEMDAASERLIVDRIRSARPDDEIIGEEGASVLGTSGVRWVIDPLDGTTNYLYRLPGWNVSIGVEVDGTPVAGAVVVPSTADRFAAALRHGATRNGRPIGVPAPAPLATALVGTGFSYEAAVRERQAANVSTLIGRVRDIRRFGAAAADLCSVACGRLDAYVESGLAPWDHCAGSVIAREAGAVVEIIDDHPLPGTLVIAVHPGRRDEFVTLLRDAGIVHPADPD